MNRVAFLLVTFFALGMAGGWSGCIHNPEPAPGPVVKIDAGDTPCATYCQLADTTLHCKFAAPTAAGASCMDVCRNANDPIGPVTFDFSCRLSQTSCEAMAKCR